MTRLVVLSCFFLQLKDIGPRKECGIGVWMCLDWRQFDVDVIHFFSFTNSLVTLICTSHTLFKYGICAHTPPLFSLHDLVPWRRFTQSKRWNILVYRFADIKINLIKVLKVKVFASDDNELDQVLNQTRIVVTIDSSTSSMNASQVPLFVTVGSPTN